MFCLNLDRVWVRISAALPHFLLVSDFRTWWSHKLLMGNEDTFTFGYTKIEGPNEPVRTYNNMVLITWAHLRTQRDFLIPTLPNEFGSYRIKFGHIPYMRRAFVHCKLFWSPPDQMSSDPTEENFGHIPYMRGERSFSLNGSDFSSELHCEVSLISSTRLASKPNNIQTSAALDDRYIFCFLIGSPGNFSPPFFIF